MNFISKAQTLEKLSQLIKCGSILPQIRGQAQNWSAEQQAIIQQVKKNGWMELKLIVRSSTYAEDQANHSMAGKFKTILNVCGEAALRTAVTQVIESFSEKNDEDEFFIQPMLQNIAMSGVAFSRDPSTNSPCYVINYDDHSQATDTVTSGHTNDLKVFICHRNFIKTQSKYLSKILLLIKELEELTKSDALDIEFAITEAGEVYLFQVRPLPSCQKLGVNDQVSDQIIGAAYLQIHDAVKSGMQPHPYLLGARTVYGVMPDWNPAEIIGIRPNPLALSLYKEVITDNIWAYQRDNYGYKNLRSFPLLINFHGLPYIDVRVSFNSFIPSTLDDALSDRLVNYYIDQLIASPSHHDKVEFNILFSCYTLDLSERLANLPKDQFSANDCESIKVSLRQLTNDITRLETGLWCKDLKKINELETRIPIIRQSQLDTKSQIYWLIEDCKRYGTLPFAGLARAGFIAVQLLQSMVQLNLLSKQDVANFMSSLDSISSQMSFDKQALSRENFLQKYGHLRPGTYDILSPRYDEEPDQYFDFTASAQKKKSAAKVSFALSLSQLKQLDGLLKQHQLAHDSIGLFDFIKAAIEGREYAKFIFSKSLSDGLSLIKVLGKECGLSVEDCAYLDITAIKSLYSNSFDPAITLQQSMETGKQNFDVTKRLLLPPLITSPEEIYQFNLLPSEPNFITLGATTGPTCFVQNAKEALPGAILFIPNADPGYDWIFSHGISGFITMYGGVNSHMAIRAAELGLPAVIGAGETLYAKWSQAKRLKIDCCNRQVLILQ